MDFFYASCQDTVIVCINSKSCVPYNGGNHSAPASPLNFFLLLALFRHPPISAMLLFCVVAICSSAAPPLARPRSEMQSDGRICPRGSTSEQLHVSLFFVCAGHLMYICASLCPDGHSVSSPGIWITVSSQPQ